MGRALGANAALLGKFETTYGVAPTGNYQQLPFVSCDLGQQRPLEASDVLGQGREPEAPDQGAVTVDGTVTVKCDLRNLGLWLKGLFGPPVTTGTAPNFSHVFSSGAASLPSLTLEVGHPEVPFYEQILGCALNSIRMPWTTTGKVNCQIAVIAQGAQTDVASSGGAPTTVPLTLFNRFQGWVRKGSTTLGGVTGVDLTYANNLEAVRTIRADGKIDGVDPLIASCKGTITTRFADVVLLDQAVNGTPVDLTLGYAIDANKALEVLLPVVYLPRPKLPINGPGGIEARFEFQAARPATGQFVQVTLKNDIPSY